MTVPTMDAEAAVSVRPARPDDAAEILRIISELARFERSPDPVALTEDRIRADGFGPDRRFEVLLAETDGRIRGAVVLFEGYSSWQGAPTLVVHDLFVDENARGGGTGRALVAAAARLAREKGCCRMDVNVMAWNARGRRFYESLGFGALEDWMPYRLDLDGVERLARRSACFT